MTGLARFVHARARRILAAAGVLFVVAAVLGGPVAGELSGEGSDFEDPGSESVRAEDRIKTATGTAPGFGVVALVRPGGDVRTDQAAAARVRGVARVLDADPAVRRTLSHPATGDAGLVARDGAATIVLVQLKDGVDEQEAVQRLRAALADRGVRLGGGEVVGPEIGDQVSEDLARAEMIAFPILFLLFSALTVAAAMASLLVFPLGFLRSRRSAACS